jgi:hypothetical protein
LIGKEGAQASDRTGPDDTRTLGGCGYEIDDAGKWTVRTIRTVPVFLNLEKGIK